MEHRLACDTPVLNTVSGLCWGDYVGSPSETIDPKIVVNDLVGAATIAAISTGEIVGLAASSCVITHETKTGDELSARTDCIWAARLCWGNSDNVLRLQIQKDKQPINFVSLPFKVTACASLADCRLLLIASDTGFIQVHRLSYSKQQSCEISWVSLVTTLTAHHSAITSLVVSPEYSIIVSADKSGLCVVWDLNKLMYVRCMESETQREVTCVTVSSTMGDIAFCSPHGRGSVMDVYTVNASPISSLTLRDRVNWLCYSSAPEGKSVNVLVGALSNGTLQLWSSWDLRPLRTLSVPGLSEPFMCCTYAQDSQYLAACTYSGRLIIWAKGGPPSTLFSRVKYFPA
ncbi:LYST [Bugula neritina]|uniref:LYST n=1 Tax=Bugula neritina TaxID=10212 RepID=A0A7J7K3K4_BUGNE|nr:LYST [Bugula neritina]